MVKVSLAAVAVAVAMALSAACGGDGDEQRIRDLVRDQERFLRAGDSESLYFTISPECRKEIGLQFFQNELVPIMFGFNIPDTQIVILEINIGKHTARVTFNAYDGDRIVATEVVGRVVKEEGKWYEEC